MSLCIVTRFAHVPTKDAMDTKRVVTLGIHLISEDIEIAKYPCQVLGL